MRVRSCIQSSLNTSTLSPPFSVIMMLAASLSLPFFPCLLNPFRLSLLRAFCFWCSLSFFPPLRNAARRNLGDTARSCSLLEALRNPLVDAMSPCACAGKAGPTTAQDLPPCRRRARPAPTSKPRVSQNAGQLAERPAAKHAILFCAKALQLHRPPGQDAQLGSHFRGRACAADALPDLGAPSSGISRCSATAPLSPALSPNNGGASANFAMSRTGLENTQFSHGGGGSFSAGPNLHSRGAANSHFRGSEFKLGPGPQIVVAENLSVRVRARMG